MLINLNIFVAIKYSISLIDPLIILQKHLKYNKTYNTLCGLTLHRCKNRRKLSLFNLTMQYQCKIYIRTLFLSMQFISYLTEKLNQALIIDLFS